MDVDRRKRISMLLEWEQSASCKAICTHEQEKYDNLLAKCCHYFYNIDRIISETQINTTRVECAINGNMHRGVYCPSPVLDLFIGGLTRGKILKRVSAASRITHKYCFNKQDQILYAESLLLDGYKEYILHEDNYIWGITVDSLGHLCALSEECYQEGKLKIYNYAEVSNDKEQIDCYQMHSEEYFYDELGLSSCVWTEYIPMSNDIRKKMLCTFERRDGYLHSYTAINQIWKQIDPRGTKVVTYTPKIKRKA